ncbi:MAG: ATPase [Flaviaesturariibacter sp.]|nr:ATPase [Flaviaesturariibacter sp.]
MIKRAPVTIQLSQLTTMQLRKATRKQAKIRLGLSAVSGGGKTYSAIQIAKGLCGDLAKVAVIDTENGSADLYAHLGDFNVLPLTAPFTPERYIEAIRSCEKAGMEVIIVDSISHEWDGKGGCLEIVESLGGKYQDWAKVTPRHQAFIDAILQSPSHVITTVRRKQDYEMTKVEGRVKVEKSGLREITREGFEYELTINLELDTRHNATASKDRTNLFMGKPSFVPSDKTGELIATWCEQGEEVLNSIRPGSDWYQRVDNCTTQKELVELYNRHKPEVDTNPLLQQLIANRRNQINGKLSAA